MSTQAPAGYELPKLATDLIAHAEANGWRTLVDWQTTDDDDREVFVHVHVGRKIAAGEDEPVHLTDPHAPVRHDRWQYKVCWHSREARAGQVKLFRRTLAQTPWRPAHHDGPPVAGLRLMISSFPDPR